MGAGAGVAAGCGAAAGAAEAAGAAPVLADGADGAGLGAQASPIWRVSARAARDTARGRRGCGLTAAGGRKTRPHDGLAARALAPGADPSLSSAPPGGTA